MIVYRLIKERFLDTPLSAEGARRFGGRWNPKGTALLYTAATPELALLETIVHLPTLPRQDLPQLYLLTLALPDSLRVIGAEELPATWRDEADFTTNHDALVGWLNSPDVLTLSVPSAVVQQSRNYLVHAAHPLFEQVAVEAIVRFDIDARLRPDLG